MSYSYYLVHGFAVIICVRGIINLVGAEASNVMFWLLLLPIFAVSVCAGGILFLCVEKPYSFRESLHRRVGIAPATLLQTGSP